MVDNDFACNGSWASYAYENLCKHNANWAKQKFCQRSCFANGAGYDGDECCDEQTHITTIAASCVFAAATISATAAAAAVGPRPPAPLPLPL